MIPPNSVKSPSGDCLDLVPGRAPIDSESNCIEDLMPAEQRHQPFAQSPAGTSLSELRLTDELSAGLRHAQRVKAQKEERGLEAAWQEKLRSLEQWICELLIKNEQLRVSLEPTMTSERGDRDASNVQSSFARVLTSTTRADSHALTQITRTKGFPCATRGETETAESRFVNVANRNTPYHESLPS